MSPDASTGEFDKIDLTERILRFALFLRARQIFSDPSIVVDALRIAQLGFVTNRNLLRSGYRACFCHNRSQWKRFDALFDEFWCVVDESECTLSDNSLAVVTTAPNVESGQRLLGFAGTSEKADNQDDIVGAGDYKALSLADFRFIFDPEEKRHIADCIDELARKARRQFFRKRKIKKKGQQIALGNSLHRSLRTYGHVVEFRYWQKQRRLPRFLLLLDVSQSMDVYAKLFLRYTCKLMSIFDQSHAFAFNTELIPLGKGFNQLTETDLENTLNDAMRSWLGGTKIADSFETFNDVHLQETVNSTTTVVIFSDGCDTAKPEKLATQVARIQQRAGKLIWVNPLLGRSAPGKKNWRMDPIAPFIDLYRSAHNLESLKVLSNELLR